MDFEKFVGGRIYEFFNVFYKMMIINLLWFGVVLIGLGVFTFMPATVALFIMMKAVLNNEDFPLFKTFFVIFKREYFKSQKIFFILFFLIMIISLNIYYYFNLSTGLITTVGIVVSFMALIIFIIIFTNIFLVYIYYPKVKIIRVFKLSFLFSMLYFIRSILAVILQFLVLVIAYYVPVIIPVLILIFMTLIALIIIKILSGKYDNFVNDREILTIDKYLI